MSEFDDYIRNYEQGKYRFNRWAGNPKGDSEDIERCMEEVYDNFTRLFYQCRRKRGYGYKGLFCKQHAKKYQYLEN